MKLSDDYSPFGKFATQILHFTLLGIFIVGAFSIGMVFIVGIYALFGLVLVAIPTAFMLWGMAKQERELFHK